MAPNERLRTGPGGMSPPTAPGHAPSGDGGSAGALSPMGVGPSGVGRSGVGTSEASTPGLATSGVGTSGRGGLATGRSAFHCKGLVYSGVREFIEQRVPRGARSLDPLLPRATAAFFLDQHFVPG